MTYLHIFLWVELALVAFSINKGLGDYLKEAALPPLHRWKWSIIIPVVLIGLPFTFTGVWAGVHAVLVVASML